jgi:NADH dehydrogenase [ubiquinone] 1 alpha subcomplex assembly factor 7
VTPLGEIIRAQIRSQGPIAVSAFMTIALGHPEYGYYRHRDPFGRAGDFITAPEISQMFGEMIGLWCVAVWHAMGEPDPFVLAELGPGRGTLMADLLRAAKVDPPFRAAMRIHLVETSPALRAHQAETLASAAPTWHDDLAALPPGPMIAVANEFFDALPIRQFVRKNGRWRERMVGLAGDSLAFVAGPEAAIAVPAAEEGAIFERGEAAAAVMATLGARIAREGGAVLAIDYGHTTTAPGDTLQAVARHRYADILAEPGEADLTAHVDFAALAAAAHPAKSWRPITQSDFLRTLGIELRAERLMRANPDKMSAIDAAVRRLIDPAEMGRLFKVLCVTHPALAAPPGFVA